jgi:hypothetical protein
VTIGLAQRSDGSGPIFFILASAQRTIALNLRVILAIGQILDRPVCPPE